MKYHRLSFYYLIVLFLSLEVCYAQINNQNGNPNFDSVFPIALSGDLNKVISILDNIDVANLSVQQQNTRELFYRRFVENSEKFDYSSNDSLIIRYVDRFHSYWKKVMLDNQTVEIADSSLENWTADFLYHNFYNSQSVSEDSIANNLYSYSNNFFREIGFYSNAFGKTGHLYDLFLWKKTDTQIYPIELVDDTIRVTVHFMQDFISKGWAHYATLGRSYAGGWATNEALFAVDDAYDRDTEQFRVSYLAHEGQHFSDYTSFPNLQQADLEYRAKLVELIKSEETTLQIFKNFIRNADANKTNAHGYANYYLITQFSKQLFNEDLVLEISKWEEVNTNLLKEYSLQLYQNHTSNLIDIGNEIVNQLITLDS